MSQLAIRIVFALLLLTAGTRGLLAESVGREVAISGANTEKFLPAAAYNSVHQEYLVVWHDKLASNLREIAAARLDRFGKVISTFTVASSANSRAQPAVAFDNVRDRYLVVYIYDYHGDGTDWDLRGRLIPWSGPDPGLVEFPIYEATDSQWNPRVAYSNGDDEYLVVWGNTSTTANASVSFRYVTAGGVPDYAQTLAGDATNQYMNPDLAYNVLRDEYMAVYEINAADVASRRLNHTGLLGSQVMVADWPDAESAPRVAACLAEDQWFVVWQNAVPKVYGRFLTGPGAVDGAPVDVFNEAAGRQRLPDVDCIPGADQYLISWEQEYLGANFGIFGRRVGADKVFPAAAFAIRAVFGSQLRDAKTPAVTGGALGWSAVWVQEREASTYSDIHGAMIWSLFADDLETGNTAMWSAVSP